MSGSIASASRLALATLLLAVAAGPVKAASNHPDFGGVYAVYNDPSQPRRGGIGDPDPSLPLTPAGKAKVDEYQSLVSEKGETPGAYCLGSGMPGVLMGGGGYPMELIQQPDQITLIFELHTEVRRLYFGSRVMPQADRVQDRDGTSTARWEGDTLVVETENMKEQVDQRYAHSANAKILERFHLEKADKGQTRLVDDITLTDPEFYTRPISFTRKWTRDPVGHMMPYECDEEAWINHLKDLRKAKAAAKG